MLRRAGLVSLWTCILAIAGAGGYYLSSHLPGRSVTRGDGASVAPVNKPTAREEAPVVAAIKKDASRQDRPGKDGPTAMPNDAPPMSAHSSTKVPDPNHVSESAPEAKPGIPLVRNSELVRKPDTEPEPRTQPKPELRLTPAEEAVLKLVNDARGTNPEKLPALKPNPILFQIARAHAAKIARDEQLDETLDEKRLGTLLTEGGYRFKAHRLGANQAADSNLQPRAAFQAWLDTNVTKEILLEPNEETGIGIVRSDKGDVFYLILFASPE